MGARLCFQNLEDARLSARLFPLEQEQAMEFGGDIARIQSVIIYRILSSYYPARCCVLPVGRWSFLVVTGAGKGALALARWVLECRAVTHRPPPPPPPRCRGTCLSVRMSRGTLACGWRPPASVRLSAEESSSSRESSTRSERTSGRPWEHLRHERVTCVRPRVSPAWPAGSCPPAARRRGDSPNRCSASLLSQPAGQARRTSATAHTRPATDG